VKVEYGTGTGDVVLLGNTKTEEERRLQAACQSEIDTATPLRAAKAVRSDRQNDQYRFAFEATLLYSTLLAAQEAIFDHMPAVRAKGKATVTFTLANGTSKRQLTNAIVTPRLVSNGGLSLDWGYEVISDPPTKV
jgi:hypothetical protein